MTVSSGATTLGSLASAIDLRREESRLVSELKAGSEDAYASLIGEFHQPVYSLIHRVVNDPADAADTTQEVFLKVFRGMKHFHGDSTLKTWIYRIAIHEASNRRRWWFRHKAQEVSIEPSDADSVQGSWRRACPTLVDRGESPFDNAAHQEIRAQVEQELRKVSEPYRTTLVLRDIQGMSYEEIADIMQVSLGTVKSRLTRGRDALRVRLTSYVRDAGLRTGAHPQTEGKGQQSRLTVQGDFEVAL